MTIGKMITGMQAIALFFILIVGTSCKTTKEKSNSAYDLCMRNPDYTWSENKCVPRESLLTAKERCENNEAGAVWMNGECVSADVVNKEKNACLSRGDGSTWKVDTKTGISACLSPAQIITSKESCKLKGSTYTWDEKTQLCLSPQAQACLAGGDQWTYDQRCVKPEEYACLSKTDGSRFVNGRCQGPKEIACIDRGFQRKWVASSNGEDVGSCDRKTFLEICGDSAIPKEIAHSLAVVKAAVSQTTCSGAHDVLQAIASITLDNNNLDNLVPLIGFDNLKAISLQNNKLKDLRVLSEMTQVEVLYLANNQITSLQGIETLINLQELYLPENLIYDLKPLGNLPELDALYLNQNKITDLTSLFEGRTSENGLAKLQTFDLSSNCFLKDVAGIDKLPSLKYFYINRTAVDKKTISEELQKKFSAFEMSPCF